MGSQGSFLTRLFFLAAIPLAAIAVVVLNMGQSPVLGEVTTIVTLTSTTSVTATTIWTALTTATMTAFVLTMASGYDVVKDFAVPIGGPIVGAIAAWTGVVLANRLSEKSKRREALSEDIYEPLIHQLDQIRRQVENGESPDPGGLQEIMHKPKFSKIAQETKTLTGRLGLMTGFLQVAHLHIKNIAETVIRKEIDRLVAERKLNATSHGYEVTYNAFIGKTLADSVKLLDCVIMGRNPYDVLRQRTFGFFEVDLECLISGCPSPVDRHVAEDFTKAVFDAAESPGVADDLKLYRSSTHLLIQTEIDALTERLKKESEGNG